MQFNNKWTGVCRNAIAAFLLFGGQVALATSGGAPDGTSGAPREGTCTACHGGTANSGLGQVRIEAAGGSYTPGQSMRLRVVIEDPAASRWGFQLSPRLEGSPETLAGSLASSNGDTQVLRDSVLQWITHTSNGTRLGARGSVTFEFDWTPPANDEGPVVFFAAANAANGDGSPSGDRIYATSIRLPAVSGQPRPAFSGETVTEAWTGQRGLAPGAWVNIAGTDLASKDVHWSPAAGQPLPTTLGGVTVKVNGVSAVLSHVSPAQITMLVPGAIPEGDLPVVIEREGQSSDTVTVTSRAALPAVHSVAETAGDERHYQVAATPAGAGVGLGLIIPTGWLLGKPSVDPRTARGVFPGEEIDLYAIGLGRAKDDFPTDRLFSAAFPLGTLPVVRFGEAAVEASLATLVSPGLYVVRVPVPASLAAGEIPLTIEVHGVSSAAGVLLNIEKLP